MQHNNICNTISYVILIPGRNILPFCNLCWRFRGQNLLDQLKHYMSSVSFVQRGSEVKDRWKERCLSFLSCLFKAGFLGWKSKHNFGYMAAAEAGLSRRSMFCCSSRHFARQRWITEPWQGKTQSRTLTQTCTLPHSFVECKVSKSLGRATDFPELF